MRKLHTLVLVPITCMVTAQSPYRPFPGSGAGWSMASGGLHFSCNPVESFQSTVTWTLGDPITVNGHLCSWLWRSEYGSWQVEGPPTGGPCPTGGDITVPNEMVGVIWQDTLARRVYLGPDTTQLLFDFSVGLGTYPPSVNNTGYPYLKVVALDSMELNDGYHRTWVLGYDQGQGLQDSAFCTLIEGVGSTFGLRPYAGWTPPFEFWDTLSCFSDGPTIFPLGATECDISLSAGTPSTGRPGISIGPNPSSDHLQVWADGSAQAWILDATGRVCADVRLSQGANVLSLNGLGEGAYALRLGTGEVLRFVKE